MYYSSAPATPRQQDVLHNILPCSSWPQIRFLTMSEAHQIISGNRDFRRKHPQLFPATEKQKLFLQKKRLWKEGLSRDEASELIGKAIEAENKALAEEHERIIKSNNKSLLS